MMNPVRFRNTIRTFAVATIGVAAITLTPIAATAQHEHHEGSTSSTPLSCDASGTPAAMGEHAHGDDGSPAAVQGEAEFDQLYIDMMLPHHGSIIALSEAALPELTDPRLKDIARNIIRAQSSENEQLTQWRIAWYGSGEPVMDDASMTLMLEAMPIGTMDEMMQWMDSGWQVSTFCAAENPDLAFIEQAIPHHQMAIDASVVAIEEAEHPELVAFAEEVITAQQAEIDQLNEILAELDVEATPTS